MMTEAGNKKVEHICLKNTGHFDFIDLCVMMPIEVKLLVRDLNTGPLLWSI